MVQTKADGKNQKAQAKWTEAQTRSLLDMLQDKTKGLNTADNNFQAPVWTTAMNRLNKSFKLELDIDQIKTIGPR